MSFKYYYALKLSMGLLSISHTIFSNYYIQNILSYLISPCVRCKRQVEKIKYDYDDQKISVNQVYFKYSSPLRKKTKSNQLIYGVNANNIKNTWKIYEQEFKIRPKIGDMIEVHYNVPFERLKPYKHFSQTPYIISYIYPCTIQFPPYKLSSIRHHENFSKNKNGVLFASCGEQDHTDKVIKLAGPMGNFYKDLPSRYGVCITRDILVDNNNKEQLIITNNHGDEFKFDGCSIITC